MWRTIDEILPNWIMNRIRERHPHVITRAQAIGLKDEDLLKVYMFGKIRLARLREFSGGEYSADANPFETIGGKLLAVMGCELQTWCKVQGLPFMMSADDMLQSVELSEAQRAYLTSFIELWNKVND